MLPGKKSGRQNTASICTTYPVLFPWQKFQMQRYQARQKCPTNVSSRITSELQWQEKQQQQQQKETEHAEKMNQLN